MRSSSTTLAGLCLSLLVAPTRARGDEPPARAPAPDARPSEPVAPVPPRVRLAVVRADGADGCGDDATIGREVARRFASSPFDPSADRSIEVVFERTPSGFSARLFARETRDGPAGTRALEVASADCAALTEPVVIAVALAIDPNAPTTPRPVAPPPPPPPPPPTRPTPPTRVTARPPAPRPAPLSWDRVSDRIALRGALVWGPIPGLAAAVGIAYATPRFGLFRAPAGTLLTQETTTRAVDRDFAFSFAALAAAACLGSAVGPLAFHGCAGAQLGLVYVSGQSSPDPVAPASYPWAALTLGGALTVRIAGPLAIEAGVDAALAPRPWRFLAASPAGDPVTVFAQSVVALVPYLGLALATH